MKPWLIILLCGLGADLQSAPHFISNHATGSNDGSSWANAWTNFNAVTFPSIGPGDVTTIDGGPVGTTNVYVGNLNQFNANANDGTPSSPITFTVAHDAAHGGTVLQYGVIYIVRDYHILDGRANTNYNPHSWVEVNNTADTNCQWQIGNTNNDGNHTITFASCGGQKIYGIKAFAAGTQQFSPGVDVNNLEMNGNSGRTKIFGCEVAYCVFGGAWGFGWEATGFASNYWGLLNFHHCLVRGSHDNYMQGDGNMDIHDSRFYGWTPPSVGHPDGAQGISQYTRIWNWSCEDQPGNCVYIEANDANGWQHFRMHDAQFLCRTQNFQSVIFVTGHDNDIVTALPINDILIANITTDDKPGSTVFGWNMGQNRTPCTVTNFHLLNTTTWLQTNATVPVFAFYTNNAFINGQRGLVYDPAQVEFNYNNVSGSVAPFGTSLGINYDKKGDYLSPGYTNFALFSADYPQYSSNNNLVATFVSAANEDFRPGADVALKNNGTNLINTPWTNDTPGLGFDMLNSTRPASGAWDIGAFQSDPRLKMWFTFHNWNGGTNITDDSGNTNNGILFSDPTNAPVVGVGQDGLNAAWFTGNFLWPGPPAETGGSIKYFGVTNLAGGMLTMTNGSLGGFVWLQTNSSRVTGMFDSGYPDINGSFYMGRYFTAATVFRAWGPDGNIINLSGFPDTVTLDGNNFQIQVGAWHHYFQTWQFQGGTNMHFISYFDGAPCFTNDSTTLTNLVIRQEPGNPANWFGISVWKHQSGPPLDPLGINPPNVGWMGGAMQDLRLYPNVTLTATEVAALAAGGGTGSSSGGGGGGGGGRNTNIATVINLKVGITHVGP